MQPPIDKYRCVVCSDRTPVSLACEACWGGMHLDCAVAVWVVRIGEECCHMLCRDCADEGGPQ